MAIMPPPNLQPCTHMHMCAHVVFTCVQVERLLIQATTSLFFNMFELNEATSGHPLSTLAFFLIMQIGSIDGWDMDVIKLAR